MESDQRAVRPRQPGANAGSADQRISGVVGLNDPEYHIFLCEFDLATRKLTEVLELPIESQHQVGLAYHDGHVRISYHAMHEGKQCVHLAKVKLAQK